MEHQRDDPSGRNWPQQYSILPNTAINKLLSQQQLHAPPDYVSRDSTSLYPCPGKILSTGNTTSVCKTCIPVIGVPTSESVYSQECVQKFKDFRSGKGSFKSPVIREKTLAIKISMRDFLDFKKLLHRRGEEEKGFPRYSYDSSSSILTIQSMSSSIHENVVSIIARGFAVALDRLPPSIEAKINIVGNERFTIFDGIYTGSEKVPDLAVHITHDMIVRDLKFVVEVGFSETYEELVQRAKVWLEGNETVSLVMLIKLEEDPCYRCPIQNLTESEFAELEFPHMNEIRYQPFTLSGPYGPAVYKGFVWVGKISGFIEFWALDPITRLASCSMTRMNLLDMGDNMRSGLWLSKLLGIDDEHDCEVHFKWGRYLSAVGADIRQLAVGRCYEMLKAREGRANILDHDYQLPSPASSA